MKAYSLLEKLTKGLSWKQNHIHGKRKKNKLQNWWEEFSESGSKKRNRQLAKQQIKKDINEL